MMYQMNPQIHLRRLKSDHVAMRELCEESPLISFKARGAPPSQYVVTYTCKGTTLQDGKIVLAERHVIEIFLHPNYPVCAPKFRLRTPMFHPNFKYGDPELQVCIEAKNWTPRENLADLVLRIGNMIVYRNFNPANPLDGDAARWADKNKHLFPLDDRPWFGSAEEDLIQILDVDAPNASELGRPDRGGTPDTGGDSMVDEPAIEIL